MKKSISKILAGVIAAASIASLAACSDDADSGVTTVSTTEKTEWTGDNIEVTTAADMADTTLDTQGKTLKWLSHYDLNPTNDSPERSVEVALFEDVYGAKIEWIQTDYMKRAEKLAELIVGGTPPDIVVYDDSNFPKDINKGMFRSVDPIIDWNDPMWAVMKATADQFTWEGEHYVAPLGYGFNDFQILMYNRDLIEELGIDDPFELYEKGQWDWDNFIRVMKDFKDSGEERLGIQGYWPNAFIATAGEVLVSYDGSKFTNNLYSAAIEGAQNSISDMMASELLGPLWANPEAAFPDDGTMFYGMGTWAYQAAAKSMEGKTIQVVPFPRNPNTDKHYMNKKIFAYMWIKESENNDVVKAWLDVNRLVNYDPEYTDITKAKFLANSPNWTEETYDLVYSFNDDEKFPFNFEYGYGLSEEFAGDNGYVRQCYDGIANKYFETWTQGREEHKNIFDAGIEMYNK